MPGGPRALSAGFDAQAAIGAALGNAVGSYSFMTGARAASPPPPRRLARAVHETNNTCVCRSV